MTISFRDESNSIINIKLITQINTRQINTTQ
jgi:hypothetical protein